MVGLRPREPIYCKMENSHAEDAFPTTDLLNSMWWPRGSLCHYVADWELRLSATAQHY